MVDTKGLFLRNQRIYELDLAWAATSPACKVKCYCSVTYTTQFISILLINYKAQWTHLRHNSLLFQPQCPGVIISIQQHLKGQNHQFFVSLWIAKKYILVSMESSKQWFMFVNNNPTSAEKLVLVMFGWGWLGWKKIATWKNLPFFFFKFFLCVVEKLPKPDYRLLFSQRNPLTFLPSAL